MRQQLPFCTVGLVRDSFSGLPSASLLGSASLFKLLHWKANTVFPLFRELHNNGEYLVKLLGKI